MGNIIVPHTKIVVMILSKLNRFMKYIPVPGQKYMDPCDCPQRQNLIKIIFSRLIHGPLDSLLFIYTLEATNRFPTSAVRIPLTRQLNKTEYRSRWVGTEPKLGSRDENG